MRVKHWSINSHSQDELSDDDADLALEKKVLIMIMKKGTCLQKKIKALSAVTIKVCGSEIIQGNVPLRYVKEQFYHNIVILLFNVKVQSR